MSRTDHRRKPRVRGHVATVRRVRHYNGQTYFQSVCSCGAAGSLAVFWDVANTDGREHYQSVYAKPVTA